MDYYNLDPEKFTAEAAKIYQQAKEATIALLKTQGKKCFVVNFEDFDNHEVYTGNDWFVTFQAVGIDRNGRLLIGGTRVYPGGGISLEEYEPSFQDTDCMYEFSYPELYAFVAKHIADCAMTYEEAEELLNNPPEDEDDF